MHAQVRYCFEQVPTLAARISCVCTPIPRFMANTNFVYLKCANCGLRTKDCITSDKALTLWNKRTGPRKITHDELEEALSASS